MLLTIDIPEKIVERAAALGLPVSTLVSQALNKLAEEPLPKTSSSPEATKPTPAKADPTIYLKLRSGALQTRLPNLPPGSVHAVLMDWHVGAGTATVLAAADGTASIYLDSGGGFIGGSQTHPAIHAAALLAMQAANGLVRFSTEIEATEAPPLPTPPDVYFYFVTAEGLRQGSATDVQLQTGGSPFVLLGYTMQRIVTEYRATQQP
jgi:hypothetical protein